MSFAYTANTVEVKKPKLVLIVKPTDNFWKWRQSYIAGLTGVTILGVWAMNRIIEKRGPYTAFTVLCGLVVYVVPQSLIAMYQMEKLISKVEVDADADSIRLTYGMIIQKSNTYKISEFTYAKPPIESAFNRFYWSYCKPFFLWDRSELIEYTNGRECAFAALSGDIPTVKRYTGAIDSKSTKSFWGF